MKNPHVKPAVLTLAIIIEQVAKDFPNFKSTVPFEETVGEWMGSNDKIMAFKSDKDEYNVRIVIKHTNNIPGEPSTYSLLRLFPGGQEWHISCDVNDKYADELFDHLLNK